MGSCKMFRLGHSFALLNISTVPKIVCIRSVSNKNLLYEKLGLPEKPKRPIPAFVVFFCNIKEDLLKKFPNTKFKDLMKEASKMWEKVTPDEKERIYEKCREEMRKYKISLAKYNSSLTLQQKAEIKEAEAEIKAIRDKKIATSVKMKRIKYLEKPKRPLNTFLRFCMTQKESKNNESVKDFYKRNAEAWKSLPESIKKKLKIEYEKEFENYVQKLETWEDRMIKEGNVDVVRAKTLKEKLQVYS